MRLDHSRHHRHALGVDLHGPLSLGGSGRDRHQPLIPDDDRAPFNHCSGPSEDPSVGDHQILGLETYWKWGATRRHAPLSRLHGRTDGEAIRSGIQR